MLFPLLTQAGGSYLDKVQRAGCCGEQGWVRPRLALRAARSKQLQQDKHGSFTARHGVDCSTLGHSSWKPVFKYPVECTCDHEDTGYSPYLAAGEVT